MRAELYTPKSKIHVDGGWRNAFTVALGCAHKRDLLHDVLIFTNKSTSVFSDTSGNAHQGMLINYDHLSTTMALSRKTIHRVIQSLVEDGYIQKITLKNNRFLLKATEKAIQLRDDMHDYSLAAKTSPNEAKALSNQFELVVPKDQQICTDKLGQIVQAQFQARTNLPSKLGQNVLAPIYSNRVNREKGKKKNNNNHSKDYSLLENFTSSDCDFVSDQFSVDERVTQGSQNQLQVDWVNSVVSETPKVKSDVLAKTNVALSHSPEMTVIFDFTDKGVGVLSADALIPQIRQASIALADFTANQQRVIETIITLFADQISVHTFESWLVRTDVKAKDFRALVSFAFKKAKGALALNALKSKLKKSTGMSFDKKPQIQSHKATVIDSDIINRIAEEDVKARIKKLVEASDQKKAIAAASPVSVNTVNAIAQPVVESDVNDDVKAYSDDSLCDTAFVKFSKGFTDNSIAQGGHVKIKNKPSLPNSHPSDGLNQACHTQNNLGGNRLGRAIDVGLSVCGAANKNPGKRIILQGNATHIRSDSVVMANNTISRDIDGFDRVNQGSQSKRNHDLHDATRISSWTKTSIANCLTQIDASNIATDGKQYFHNKKQSNQACYKTKNKVLLNQSKAQPINMEKATCATHAADYFPTHTKKFHAVPLQNNFDGVRLKNKFNLSFWTQSLKNSDISGHYYTVSDSHQVGVCALTFALPGFNAFMVGLAHEYHSLMANNVRRFLYHGFSATRSPFLKQKALLYMKPTRIIYTPNSKIHIDLGWEAAFIRALGGSDYFNILIRVIHSSNNPKSVFRDSKGVEHQGMLIHYDYLSDNLCLSRSTLQRIFKHLESKGYLRRIHLGFGRVLVQATDKAFQLRDEIHAHSLAAKTHADQLPRLSQRFKVVEGLSQKTNAALTDKALDQVGQFDRANNKVKIKNNNHNNQKNDSLLANSKPTDCETVIFDNFASESGQSDTKEVSNQGDDVGDARTIGHDFNRPSKRVIAESNQYLNQLLVEMPLSTIESLTAKLIDQHLLEHKHEIVNASLLKLGLIDDEAAWEFDQQGMCGFLANKGNAFKINQSTTQTIKQNASIPDATDESTEIISANQPDHTRKLAAQDQLKMPIIEKEVLRKDWASLADQNFYEGVLPDCQKIALVAVIDYVKRKGVVIGSDEEVYRWLYHAASNHRYYYSKATSFKHLVNILIKALMAKRFNKPSGFERWKRFLENKPIAAN